MSVHSFLLWVIVYILFLWICVNECVSMWKTRIKSPKSVLSMRELFPAHSTKYEIKALTMEQSGIPKQALVQTYRSPRGYKLWNLFPFSLYPPAKMLYSSGKPFSWAVCQSFRVLLIVSSAFTVLVFEQSRLGKGTMGSWHLRQTLRLTNHLIDGHKCQISMSLDGNMAFILSPQEGLFCLTRKSKDKYEYTCQRTQMNRMIPQTKFSLLHDSLFLTSAPLFRQLDGLVDLHQVSSGKQIEHRNTIQAPKRGTAFGWACALTPSHVIVSAPTAPAPCYGCGEVYVYGYGDKEPKQILKHPDVSNMSPEEQSTLQFGQSIAVSKRGTFLAVYAYRKGPGEVVVFRKGDEEEEYELQRTWQWESIIGEQFGHALSIDEEGTLLAAHKHAVYFQLSSPPPSQPSVQILSRPKMCRQNSVPNLRAWKQAVNWVKSSSSLDVVPPETRPRRASHWWTRGSASHRSRSSTR